MLVWLKALSLLIPGWLKRAVLGGVGVVAILWGAAEWQQSVGKKELLADSKAEGKQINETNAKIRADVLRPGAAQRVREKYCRDC